MTNNYHTFILLISYVLFLQGALALEDALMKGLPVQTEVDMLRASLADIKNDTLVDLVLSSLPEETLNNGTYTKLQLNQKVSLYLAQ